MKPNLEDSGNCSTTSDDEESEVTNEFENLIARATQLISASPATSHNKVKDNTSTTNMSSMLEAALENDIIMG